MKRIYLDSFNDKIVISDDKLYGKEYINVTHYYWSESERKYKKAMFFKTFAFSEKTVTQGYTLQAN